MASGISSTRQAATRICLCELVGLEGPAPAANPMSLLLLCVVGDTFRLLFHFSSFVCILFFYSFLFSILASLLDAAAAAAPIIVSPNSVLWPPVSSPFFLSSGFSKTLQHMALAWRGAFA